MAIEAGRLIIQNINECVKKSESFAFETTLSGKGYINKISNWKTKQYEIIDSEIRYQKFENSKVTC